jgi:hypothetical protein
MVVYLTNEKVRVVVPEKERMHMRVLPEMASFVVP